MDKEIILKKLRIKPDMKWMALNKPVEFSAYPGEIAGKRILEFSEINALILFADSKDDLQKRLPEIFSAISQDAVFWISYPKQSSGTITDLNRDILWHLMKKNGYKAISQVALDAKWSALRFKPETKVTSKKLNTPSIDTVRRIVKVPKELKSAFVKNKKAAEFYNALSFTHKKEYVIWIESAKKEDTRKNRALKAVDMLNAKQKSR